MAASLGGSCSVGSDVFYIGAMKIEPDRMKLKNLHCYKPLPGYD
jgi:hypothetical protein